jgi:hypothetical protein
MYMYVYILYGSFSSLDEHSAYVYTYVFHYVPPTYVSYTCTYTAHIYPPYSHTYICGGYTSIECPGDEPPARPEEGGGEWLADVGAGAEVPEVLPVDGGGTGLEAVVEAPAGETAADADAEAALVLSLGR